MGTVQGFAGDKWTQDPDCSGMTVNDDCDLRDSEMLLVSYTPAACEDDELEGCKELQSFARFNIKERTQEEALMNILKTIFVGLILAAASVTFTIDTQTIVIAPITKMVLIIKNLADDPLKKPDPKEEKSEEFEFRKEENIGMLEDTIFKIGSLLQTSFGEDGAEILSKNMMSGEGELNLMRPGNKFSISIAVIRIEHFSQITEALGEDTVVFLNHLCALVHKCAREWSGISSKFARGAFLVVWRMPELSDKDTEEDDLTNPAMQRTDLANRSLIAIVKIMAELRRSRELAVYSQDPRILQKFGGEFNVLLTACLDLGMAIEGVIGSELKIDPVFLSPHIWLANKLLDVRQEFGVGILITEELYGYLSVKAKSSSRRIDTLYNALFPTSFGLYTFDMNQRELPAPHDHEIGKLIKLQELDSVNVESFQHKGVDFMFTLDSDLVNIQKDIPQHFYDSFRHAYVNYISGQWEEAVEFLEKALSYIPNDGPSLSIKRYIQNRGGSTPDDWARFRELL